MLRVSAINILEASSTHHHLWINIISHRSRIPLIRVSPQTRTAKNLLRSRPLVPYGTVRITIIGEGRAGKSSSLKSIIYGARVLHISSAKISMLTCLYSIEKFEDTESTCGVATCDVINVHGDDWNKSDAPEAVKLMRRQMVPRCRVCKTAPRVFEQRICVSCAMVGWRSSCHLCFYIVLLM